MTPFTRHTLPARVTSKWAKSNCKQLLSNRPTTLWGLRGNRTYGFVDISFSKASLQPAAAHTQICPLFKKELRSALRAPLVKQPIVGIISLWHRSVLWASETTKIHVYLMHFIYLHSLIITSCVIHTGACIHQAGFPIKFLLRLLLRLSVCLILHLFLRTGGPLYSHLVFQCFFFF